MNNKDIALLPINSLDQPTTVGEYLKDLLRTLWAEGDGFSPKRPMGDSGWQHDIYISLVENNVVNGKLDEDGYLEDLDDESADEIIQGLIKSIVFGEE